MESDNTVAMPPFTLPHVETLVVHTSVYAMSAGRLVRPVRTACTSPNLKVVIMIGNAGSCPGGRYTGPDAMSNYQPPVVVDTVRPARNTTTVCSS